MNILNNVGVSEDYIDSEIEAKGLVYFFDDNTTVTAAPDVDREDFER